MNPKKHIIKKGQSNSLNLFIGYEEQLEKLRKGLEENIRKSKKSMNSIEQLLKRS